MDKCSAKYKQVHVICPPVASVMVTFLGVQDPFIPRQRRMERIPNKRRHCSKSVAGRAER